MKKTKNTYIRRRRLLAFLVNTVLHDLGMRAEHVDDFGATKLTGKVKRGFKALEHQDRRSITDSVGGGYSRFRVFGPTREQQLTALSGVLR